MLKSASGVQMFGDVARRKRYFYALVDDFADDWC